MAGSVVNEISDRDGLLITRRVIGGANAHLIAAAPEMLEALRAVLSDVSDIDNDSLLSLMVGRMVKAAIAKAEGRS